MRTGLEDSRAIDAARREPNAALVRRVAELAEIAGRPLATAARVRERLALTGA